MTGLAPATPRASSSKVAGRLANRRPLLKLLLLSVVLVGLGGVIGFSVSRELAGVSETAGSSAADGSRNPPRPAFTADEQAYVDALWPIHTEVEVAAERVALGTILYKTSDLDRSELQGRLEQALASYRAADAKLQALPPPDSLRSWHQNYVAALGLFEQSTVEMLRMFDDGDENHLQTGYPMYLDGTNKIRDVGGNFWPDEFPPN
jgi:hypothetical protein